MEKRIKMVVFICALLIAAIFTTTGCAKKKDKDAVGPGVGNDEYSPVSGIAMTDTEAAALNNSVKVKVYYKTAKGDKISYETKLMQFTDKDRKADVLATKIVELLVAGPANSNLVKTIPEGTKVNSVKIKGNVVYVDFNEAFSSAVAKGTDAKFVAYAIADTLTEFKNINKVAITANGAKIQTEAGCNFSELERNMDIVTDIAGAALETDYSENVFLEIELE